MKTQNTVNGNPAITNQYCAVPHLAPPHSIVMIQKKAPFGFTLIELLLSIVLISFIVSFSIPFYHSLQTKNNLSLSAFALTQNLREARLRAKAMEGDLPWGVALQEGSIILFQGQNYAHRNVDLDQVFYLSPSIKYTGIDEIVFDKFTGYPQKIGSITLKYSDNHFIQIHINEKGLVY